MKEQGYITEEEYTIAMNDNVYDRIAMHTQSQAESAPYSYFIDEVITNLINDLMVQKGYTEVQAKNVVYSGGLKIYTTQDSYRAISTSTKPLSCRKAIRLLPSAAASPRSRRRA